MSQTSLEVRPRCIQRPSGPNCSVIDDRNAVTSWRVLARISLSRVMSWRAPRSLAMSSAGITPSAVHASQTANSTSSHLSYLFSSDQTCFIFGLA